MRTRGTNLKAIPLARRCTSVYVDRKGDIYQIIRTKDSPIFFCFRVRTAARKMGRLDSSSVAFIFGWRGAKLFAAVSCRVQKLQDKGMMKRGDAQTPDSFTDILRAIRIIGRKKYICIYTESGIDGGAISLPLPLPHYLLSYTCVDGYKGGLRARTCFVPETVSW